jgi:fructose-bisphosphate aldolase, class II
MTVATLKKVLAEADKRRCAVAGVVVLGWEDARAYVEAAEAVGCPLILQAGPGCRKNMPVAVLGKMFRVLMENASVPVVAHIDHARTLDECLAGIDAGFTSVMIDGSALPLEKNIALTRSVVERAHAAGVSVEGEVGFVGYVGGAASAVTTADDARALEVETGIDALAVSVGNVHLSTEKFDGIDFVALGKIEAVTSVPLVLHGGSGIESAVRQKLAREHRVRKFNIGTELRMAFGVALRDVLARDEVVFDRVEIFNRAMPEVKDVAINVFRELARPELYRA